VGGPPAGGAAPGSSGSPVPARAGGAGGAAQPDAALQAGLEAAVVPASVLPAGYRPALATARPPLFLDQTAQYYARFTRGAGQTNAGAIAVVLLGFRDAATASARLKSGRAQINSFLTSGGGQRVEAVPGGPELGDETVLLHVLRVTDNVGRNDGGYELLWRRGNVVAVVMQTGNPEPAGPDAVIALAQHQDDSLASAVQ
jgi:hypothetical protein